jgi:hypothetical protein
VFTDYSNENIYLKCHNFWKCNNGIMLGSRTKNTSKRSEGEHLLFINTANWVWVISQYRSDVDRLDARKRCQAFKPLRFKM